MNMNRHRNTKCNYLVFFGEIWYIISIMMTHIHLTPTNNENATNMLRRFTKAVRSSAIVTTSKAKRYHNREMSVYKTKLSALRRLAGAKAYNYKLKMGKIQERTQGGQNNYSNQNQSQTQSQ
jgi:Ribosomal protein S21